MFDAISLVPWKDFFNMILYLKDHEIKLKVSVSKVFRT